MATTATTFKKQGMWIRSWGDDDPGGDNGGVGQRQREQNKKARELVKKMKSQGWTKISNKNINKTLNDQNLVPQLRAAIKKYNADVKKKWGGKTIKMWSRCLAANHFIIDLDNFQEYWLTDDDPAYHEIAVNYFSGELGGYGAMMKKGNQYRLIMTGGTDDDEAGYWSTPVVQFALKSASTHGKAPPKPKHKTKAKKKTRKKKAKKKTGRKAPTISATKRKVGTRMRGNDGKMWQVKKSGKSQRWMAGSESFSAPEDAYAMAYNDGHRDGRNKTGYDPTVVKLDRQTFRDAYKMNAESFESVTDDWIINRKRSNPLSRHYVPQKSAESFEAQRQPPWSAANPMPNRKIECGECDARGNTSQGECSKCDGAGYWTIMSPKCAICDDWIVWDDGAECDECNKWYCDAHYDIDNNSCVVCGDPMTDSQSMLKHSEDYRWENCDNERSFLISILSDRQLDEFLEFEEDSYSAEYECDECGEMHDDTAGCSWQKCLDCGTEIGEKRPGCQAHYEICAVCCNCCCNVCGDYLPSTPGANQFNSCMCGHQAAETFEADTLEDCEERESGWMQATEELDDNLTWFVDNSSKSKIKEFNKYRGWSAETKLGKDSCCCGATKTNPCACMIQGVMNCNATCPCSLEKKNTQFAVDWGVTPTPFCRKVEKTQRWNDGRYSCSHKEGHAGLCSNWSRSGSGMVSFEGYLPCKHIIARELGCDCILGDGVDDSTATKISAGLSRVLGEKKAEGSSEWNCVICGHKSTGYGNNPEPVASFDSGRCCDTCNSTVVIPTRLGGSFGAEEGCSCPVCGTQTEVIREYFDDDTSWVDLVVCDNCCWMEELEGNEEEYEEYMEEMLAMLDEEPDADLLEKPNVVVDTSWDWSDGVGPPPSQQTLDLEFDAEASSKHDWVGGEVQIYRYDHDAAGYPTIGIPDPRGRREWFCIKCGADALSEDAPPTGPCQPPEPEPKITGTCPHCKEEVDHVGTAQVFYCPACHEDLGPSDMRGDDEPADWAKDVGLLEAEGDELTDEEKQEGWNIFQEEAASIEDPDLEQIKTLADKYLLDVIDDETPEFFVDPGLEDYYQYILTDPTYPEGGEPEDEEAAAMFEELKHVRYWATILTDQHIEQADTAAKAMIAAGIMGDDKELFDQGMLGLDTNNQVQRERELIAQWLAEGGVHEN